MKTLFTLVLTVCVTAASWLAMPSDADARPRGYYYGPRRGYVGSYYYPRGYYNTYRPRYYYGDGYYTSPRYYGGGYYYDGPRVQFYYGW